MSKNLKSATPRLREDLLKLMEEYQRQQGAKGVTLSDSKVSMLAMGYGDFIHQLRRWDGEPKGGPTIGLLMKFETFLRDQVGEDAYAALMKRRAVAALGIDEF